MADHSKIEWTDATWNPITGCAVVSPGCANCYAMKLAGGRLQHHWSRAGLTQPSKAGPVWNGQVRFNQEWLDQPIRWRRPRRIFVCAHGDLFHESVPFEWIDWVWAVMARSPHHQFQVLTKRADRMREYLQQFYDGERTGRVTRRGMHRFLIQNAVTPWDDSPPPSQFALDDFDRDAVVFDAARWPLPNVWLGVSVENQDQDWRIANVLDSPAAVRYVSYEPAIGPLDLTQVLLTELDDQRRGTVIDVRINALMAFKAPWRGIYSQLDWVICGGESGPGARPMHPDWARKVRDDCERWDVPFFFKQWGEWSGGRLVGKAKAGRILDQVLHDAMPRAAA